MLGATTDLLRLVAVPVFAWAAYLDIKTRRVPSRTWYPLFALAVFTLAWDSYTAHTSFNTLFFIKAVIGIGFMIPLVTAFWQTNSFGGADARALYIITLLFPVVPEYILFGIELPLHQSEAISVFSITILSNTVVAGALYPLGVAFSNLIRGKIGLPMVVGQRIPWEKSTERYGVVIQTPSSFVMRGLDLDALRMYLNWRDCSLSEIRDNAERYRDPSTLPEEPGEVGDGNITADEDSETKYNSGPSSPKEPDNATSEMSSRETKTDISDPWGAEAFLDDVENAYGTTPEKLRDGLDVLIAEDEIWISPGIPFIVPMFVGLLISLIYGDVLVSLLGALGLA